MKIFFRKIWLWVIAPSFCFCGGIHVGSTGFDQECCTLCGSHKDVKLTQQEKKQMREHLRKFISRNL